MGIPLFTRLWWSLHDGKCVARHKGVEVEMPQPPRLTGLPDHLTVIDYFTHRGELRVSAERQREMTADECAAVLTFLERMADAARAPWDSETP